MTALRQRGTEGLPRRADGYPPAALGQLRAARLAARELRMARVRTGGSRSTAMRRVRLRPGAAGVEGRAADRSVADLRQTPLGRAVETAG